MAHPRDEDVYPFGTKVYRPKTKQKGIIVDHTFLKDGKNFLHYLIKIEGKEGNYCWLHDEIEKA